MRTQVRVVFSKGSSSVVEWVDDSGSVNRSILPSTELIEENGEVFVENVEEGQPYGEDWENYIHTKVGPKGIAALLRKNGIWTREDFDRNTRAVNFSFQEAATANLQAFRDAVLRREEKDE